MKTFLKSVFIVAIFFCKLNHASAQSRIMDASIQWSGGAGTLTVFLTDIDNLSGLKIDMGETADSFGVYNTTYTISGNNFGSAGTVSPENVLSVPIGNYATNSDYFIRIRVLLTNSGYNEIEIHTTN
jgi:hypothetical protein